MHEGIIYFLIGLVFFIFGFAIAMLFLKNKQQELHIALATRKQENLQLQKQLDQAAIENNEKEKQLHLYQEKLGTDQQEIALKNARISYLQEQLQELKEASDKAQKRNLQEFQILANKVLEEKSSTFSKQNKEQLRAILNPLKERIGHFEKQVQQSQKESIDQHAVLREQITGLKNLNQKISNEANQLTKALKGDAKTQGNWGELILEKVLERSGLEKGREYEVEQSFQISDGDKKRLRPDVVVHLPNKKNIIIDSKISLTAYERYSNAEHPDTRSQFLKAHLLSVKKHVQELSKKNYQDLLQGTSPDFVLLFMAIEPAFALAIKSDHDLYTKALDQGIILVTPTSLLATLRTIESMWQNEKQHKNALEIAKQAGALHDKFVGFIKDLELVGSKMKESEKAYEQAVNKLYQGKGNLLTKVSQLKTLGAKAKKQLPE